MATEIDKNTSAALSYVLGPVTGLAFFIINKDPFVRFHAVQSILTFSALILLIWIISLVGFIAGFSSLVVIFTFILYLILIYTAWSGQSWQVPIIGEFVTKILGKQR